MSARPPRSRGRGVTADEMALWRSVAQSVRAAGPSQRTPPPETVAAADRSAPPRKLPPRAAVVLHRAPASSTSPRIAVTHAGGAIDPLGPRTPGLDRRTAKRLSRGEHTPDARIDLHGMTSERAHSALISFIIREQAAGARCVLVITGKGRREDRDATWRSGGAGVLKTMTPEWLRQPPCGGLVVGVYQAHQRHGGDGALYVYLRKRR